MRFEIVGRNISITDAMRSKIEKKFSALDKYLLIDENTVARVVVKSHSSEEKIEVTIPTKVGLLRSEVRHDDLYAAIDIAVDKLEDQLRRQKTRLNRRHRESLAEAFIEEAEAEERSVPVKTKTIQATTLDLDEAIMQMELSDHSFYIYTDDESGRLSVVYLRNDGEYGLIEVEQ